MLELNRELMKNYSTMNTRKFSKISDYEQVYHFFMKQQQKNHAVHKILLENVQYQPDIYLFILMPWFRCFPQRRSFFRFPSLEEPFKSVVNNATWREDRVFAEQRLAGLNPMSLMKVTEGEGENRFNLFYEFFCFITSTFTS